MKVCSIEKFWSFSGYNVGMVGSRFGVFVVLVVVTVADREALTVADQPIHTGEICVLVVGGVVIAGLRCQLGDCWWRWSRGAASSSGPT